MGFTSMRAAIVKEPDDDVKARIEEEVEERLKRTRQRESLIVVRAVVARWPHK